MKKKVTLKNFSSEELLQELITRGMQQEEMLRAEAEGMEVEADAIEEDINTLNAIELGW